MTTAEGRSAARHDASARFLPVGESATAADPSGRGLTWHLSTRTRAEARGWDRQVLGTLNRTLTMAGYAEGTVIKVSEFGPAPGPARGCRGRRPCAGRYARSGRRGEHQRTAAAAASRPG